MTLSRLLPWGLAAVLVLAYGCEQRARGRAEAGQAAAVRSLDSLRRVARITDTVYRRDTLRLRVYRDRWDTAYVDVEQWKHDTVEVVRYVTLADSTIRACSAALNTCEQRVADRDAMLRQWQARWDTREQPPGAVRRWTERLLWGGVWYAIGSARP